MSLSLVDRALCAALPGAGKAIGGAARTALREGKNLRPIVIQGGLGMSAREYMPLRALLRREGFDVAITKLPRHGFAPIERDAKALSRAVDDMLRQRPDADMVTILAHSKGGLSSRHFVQELGGLGTTSQIISLGSPHMGMAPVGDDLTRAITRRGLLPEPFGQFSANSPFMHKLSVGLEDTIHAADLVNPEFRIVSIRGNKLVASHHNTDFVVSEKSARLPEHSSGRLINHRIDGVGHGALAGIGRSDPRVMGLIDAYAGASFVR